MQAAAAEPWTGSTHSWTMLVAPSAPACWTSVTLEKLTLHGSMQLGWSPTAGDWQTLGTGGTVMPQGRAAAIWAKTEPGEQLMHVRCTPTSSSPLQTLGTGGTVMPQGRAAAIWAKTEPGQ